MSPHDVEKYIIALARSMSAIQSAGPEDHVYRDLRISGGDAVEFYEDIESRFGVDIRPITEKNIEVTSRWRRKIDLKTVPCDPSLGDISSYIVRAKSEIDE